MKAAHSYLKKLQDFRNDTSGSIFVLTALMLFVIFLSSGAAIDYTRMVSKKTKMDAALDAAILATGIELSQGVTDANQLRQTFENFFLANVQTAGDFGALDNGSGFQIVSFSADPDTGAVSGEVASSIDATLMQLAGYDELDISSDASSVFEQTDVEVAMMLDVTGSMGGQKIRDLRAAATDAVDILLPNTNTRGVRIGLVPYASSINAGGFATRVTRGNETTVAGGGFVSSINVPTNNCVSGRGGRDAVTDAYSQNSPLGSDSRTVNGALTPVRRKCPIATVQPLTNDRAELKRQIQNYIADGYTAGHLGIAWSYYLLSENWQPLFNSSNKPADYSPDVQKIAILMTDGEFNTAFEGIPGGGNNAPFNNSNSVNVSNTRAVQLCDDMKRLKSGNPGIIIYSIAFQAPTSAEATLRDCANTDTVDTTYYYSASNGQQLREAFRAIAASIGNLRITG